MPSRSVRGELQNDTPYQLYLEKWCLQHGRWTYGAKPSNIVGTHGCEIFCSESCGFMTGTEGYLYYEVNGIRFKIMWNNPYMGDNSYSYTTPNGFIVTRRGGSGDNSHVYFKISENEAAIQARREKKRKEMEERRKIQEQKEFKAEYEKYKNLSNSQRLIKMKEVKKRYSDKNIYWDGTSKPKDFVILSWKNAFKKTCKKCGRHPVSNNYRCYYCKKKQEEREWNNSFKGWAYNGLMAGAGLILNKTGELAQSAVDKLKDEEFQNGVKVLGQKGMNLAIEGTKKGISMTATGLTKGTEFAVSKAYGLDSDDSLLSITDQYRKNKIDGYEYIKKCGRIIFTSACQHGGKILGHFVATSILCGGNIAGVPAFYVSMGICWAIGKIAVKIGGYMYDKIYPWFERLFKSATQKIKSALDKEVSSILGYNIGIIKDFSTLRGQLNALYSSTQNFSNTRFTALDGHCNHLLKYMENHQTEYKRYYVVDFNKKLQENKNENEESKKSNENECDEESKNELLLESNDNKIKIMDFVINSFWKKCGKKMKINGKTVTYFKDIFFYSQSEPDTAYSSLSLCDGVHEMKFKITRSEWCGMFIGIASGDGYAVVPHRGGASGYAYGYFGEGYKHAGHHENDWEKYGDTYSLNDIITLHLDFNKLIISFDKNGKSQGVLSKIWKGKYCVAVTMESTSGALGIRNTSGSIEIISYIKSVNK